MTRYDNLPEKDARRAALQTLALAKWIQDQAKNLARPLEEEAKMWLAEHVLDPGARVPALIDDDEVATVSRSKRTTRRTYEITDEQAFGDWLVAQGHSSPFEVRLADWAKNPALLQDLAEKDGELPDGVTVSTSHGGGTVSVRQTPAQRGNLEEHVAALQQLTTTFDALAIENGDQS